MKKRICIAVGTVLFCLLLLGCGKQSGEVPASTKGEPSSAGAEKAPQSTTRHITQVLTENRRVDAQVILPGKQQYSTYTLKRVEGDPDYLFGIFAPEGYGGYTTEDCENYMLYRESTGKKLAVREDAIDYQAYDADSGNHPMQEVANLMYYYTLEHPQAQPHDLSFMTVAEMEKYGKDLLTQLGVVWEAELVNCVTLSGQEILDFQKEMFGKPSYTEFGTPMPLTTAEETCYLEFTFSYDGIPLYGPKEPGISFSDGVQPPMPAGAAILLNAQGIQSCDVRCACFAASASEPQDIISVENCLASLKAYYEQEPQFGTVEITDIWMEYIPVKQGQTLVLTPYWCFWETDPQFREGGAVQRFHALTGSNMAYGG